VSRGFISLIPASASLSIGSKESGRLQLAEWITGAENPLTSRVIVNRIWRHLFGAGIVRTVDNFGSTGEKPSHPELLDYLASRFTAEDHWSFKTMIREIVLSKVYQLDSHPISSNMGIDPDNKLLWRMAPRRLEAEAIRDSMLAISGKLEIKPPGDSPV